MFEIKCVNITQKVLKHCYQKIVLFSISFCKFSSLAKFTCKLQKFIDETIIFRFICQETSQIRQDFSGKSEGLVTLALKTELRLHQD